MISLEIQSLSVAYGDMIALHDVSLNVAEGEMVTVLGANAAGKTTLLRAISGLVPVRKGSIRFLGENIERVPAHERVERGLIQVPEGRMVFPFLSVEDNLRLGAYSQRARSKLRESLEKVFGMFPKLLERRNQMAGSLSGGEQQMLAIGRALMGLPRLLMLDEPSLGLSPLMVHEIFHWIEGIRKEGITLLIVEQNVHHALRLADRGYVLENGHVALSGSSGELSASDMVRKAYLGL